MTPAARTAAEQHMATSRAKLAREGRSDAWLKRGLLLSTVGFAGAWAWSSYTTGKLAEQLARKEVIHSVLRDDGTLVSSAAYSALPPSDGTQANRLNALWQYVVSRECYSAAHAATDWTIVQSMSDARVNREYKEWFRPTNPQSPQVIYGMKGIRIDCEFVGLNTNENDPDNYQVRFDRTEVGPNGANKPVRYVAALRYRTGVYDPDPKRGWVSRVTYNAPGIQVWEYPAIRPEGGAPSYRAAVAEAPR